MWALLLQADLNLGCLEFLINQATDLLTIDNGDTYNGGNQVCVSSSGKVKWTMTTACKGALVNNAQLVIFCK